MGRKRLTAAEREARRKARSAFTFSDAAYQHYDPDVSGYGRPEQWEQIAERLFGIGPRLSANKNLAILGLAAPPKTLAELKHAFRAAMMKNHPDHGGTNELARDTMAAFATLKRAFT